eukprot:280963-Chlamydomonas_euryale.AAC.3
MAGKALAPERPIGATINPTRAITPTRATNLTRAVTLTRAMTLTRATRVGGGRCSVQQSCCVQQSRRASPTPHLPTAFPPQVSRVLYERLGLPTHGISTTASGFSTNEAALQQLVALQ